MRYLFGIWILAVNLTGEQSESIHFSYCAMPGAGIKRRIESVYSIDTDFVGLDSSSAMGSLRNEPLHFWINLVQAFIMAPFFVLLEALQTSFGYEPYPGFHASVQAKIDADMKEWREKNLKLLS
uniref:Putative endoplasmic reticulum membrane protein C16E8.02-like n=1 Tax=Populus alba TaxID=43335 RepID=A0A4U5QP73_POPAL|nr:putative endoplasmic reticulum membrane protein C16E8.02-like [Populus alba]